MEIKWLGHASFKLKGKKVIYIDPFQIKDDEKADIILITHEHYDHCSREDVLKISDSNTILVVTPDCLSKLNSLKVKQMIPVEPNQKREVDGIQIETVPAYNLNKMFHPKGNNWVGYIVTLDGRRIYHAGDTDKIPEMNHIKADVALLPIGGTYTMNAKEAAQAALAIKPKIAVPMHYGSIVGSKQDLELFKKELAGKVMIEIL